MFLHSIYQTLLIQYRRRSEWGMVLSFFVMVCVLFSLGVSPDPIFLSQVGVGVIWVAAFLSVLLILPLMFRDDYLDGFLVTWALSPYPLWIFVWSRMIAQWIMLGGPLILLVPLLAIGFHLPFAIVGMLAISLFLGLLAVIAVGMVGAALTVVLKNGGVLLSLLVLPLWVPTLIFGSATTLALLHHQTAEISFLLLLATVCLTLACCPFIASLALRHGISSGF